MISEGSRVVLTLAALLVLGADPAGAHAAASLGPGGLIGRWTLDPLVLVPLAFVHALYGRGVHLLQRSSGRLPLMLPAWRVGCFVAGELVLVLALVSPLDALSGRLLAAHMAQHVLLIAVAPALIALGRPEIACFRGLPAATRRKLARSRAWRGLARLFAAATQPLTAALLHGVALWVWHAPPLFEAAGANEILHWLEHLFFFATALLFWRSLVKAGRSAAAAAAGMAAALVTLVHGGFMSALITLSAAVLYPTASPGAALWGMTALDDQQLAGVIMWVPAGAAYLAAGLVLAARLLTTARPPPRILPGRPSPA